MRDRTLVDDAFSRYRVLSSLIDLELERARANPGDVRYVRLGIVETGDTKREALEKVVRTFDELAKLIEHVAILDMTSSLERTFRERIANVIGAARGAIKKELKRDGTDQLALKLLRSGDDFEGLRDIHDLIEHAISKETSKALMLLRGSRNAFAHGTDLQRPPSVEPADARTNLNEIIFHL